jgi:uncharacterized membrane protein
MGSSELPAGTDTAGAGRQGDMDELVGYILQVGVLLSMVLIAAGLFWTWLRTHRLMLNYQISNMNLFEFTVSEFRLAFRGALRPRLLVNLGIIALMLTPFVRVAASVVYFAAVLKNWKYTLFTAVVLGVLTHSLFLR